MEKIAPNACCLVLSNYNLFSKIIRFTIAQPDGAKTVVRAQTVCKKWRGLLNREVAEPVTFLKTTLIKEAKQVIFADMLVNALYRQRSDLIIEGEDCFINDFEKTEEALRALLKLRLEAINWGNNTQMQNVVKAILPDKNWSYRR